MATYLDEDILNLYAMDDEVTGDATDEDDVDETDLPEDEGEDE